MPYLYDRHNAIESWNIQTVLYQNHTFITTFIGLLVRMRDASVKGETMLVPSLLKLHLHARKDLVLQTRYLNCVKLKS